jgi:hypothetical protein
LGPKTEFKYCNKAEQCVSGHQLQAVQEAGDCWPAQAPSQDNNVDCAQDEGKEKQSKIAVSSRHNRKREIAGLLKLLLKKASHSKCTA